MLTTPGHEKPPGAETSHARPRALSNDRARAVPTKRRKRMSFSDHKITAFTHRIADLPDQPNLPADELKARFDSSPEELRVAHNAVCDDAARLEARVEGIVAETFGDTITESMLSQELSADMARRSDLYWGTYIGNSEFPRDITLGFAPQMVFVMRADGMTGSVGYTYQCLAFPKDEMTDDDFCLLTANGFQLIDSENKRSRLNSSNITYVYAALK